MKISEIIKNHKSDVFPKIGYHKQHILSTIEKCRTPELGGHLYICEECQSVHLLNNSCSNRNCPVCQGNKRKQWIDKQCSNLINAPYFHVVFTVPDVLNELFLHHQVDCYNALYHSVWGTLKLFFAGDENLKGKGGMLCILHTWGQNLAFHPHLHCLVPAAGISADGEFKLVKGRDKFLFNVKGMSEVFRAKFAEEMTALEKSGKLKFSGLLRKQAFAKNWVVFAQRPFSTPENVVRYIGMYSHRVAISENRISDDKDGKISFWYKDYKDGGKKKIIELPSDEFLRRFSMHILPKKFMKIRYYGLFNNRCKKDFIHKAKAVVGLYSENKDAKATQTPKIAEELSIAANDILPVTDDSQEYINELDYGLDDEPVTEKKTMIICPVCKTGKLIRLAPISVVDFESGIIVVNTKTGEIVFRTRDGPVTDNFKVILS